MYCLLGAKRASDEHALQAIDQPILPVLTESAERDANSPSNMHYRTALRILFRLSKNLVSYRSGVALAEGDVL